MFPITKSNFLNILLHSLKRFPDKTEFIMIFSNQQPLPIFQVSVVPQEFRGVTMQHPDSLWKQGQNPDSACSERLYYLLTLLGPATHYSAVLFLPQFVSLDYWHKYTFERCILGFVPHAAPMSLLSSAYVCVLMDRCTCMD